VSGSETPWQRKERKDGVLPRIKSWFEQVRKVRQPLLPTDTAAPSPRKSPNGQDPCAPPQCCQDERRFSPLPPTAMMQVSATGQTRFRRRRHNPSRSQSDMPDCKPTCRLFRKVHISNTLHKVERTIWAYIR
jgi:hypothetical protein